MKTVKKAVVYCRARTETKGERRHMLKAQENQCRYFANENGYEVEKVFIDLGGAGSTHGRPGLSSLQKYAAKNKNRISAVICYATDRMARRLTDWYGLAGFFKALKIHVLVVSVENHRLLSLHEC